MVFDNKEIIRCNNLAISDWIMIENFNGLARVLEFKCLQAKTISQGRVRASVIAINETNGESIGMLLEYFTVNRDGKITPADVTKINDSGFLPLKAYVAHVPAPLIQKSEKNFDKKFLSELNQTIDLSPKKTFKKNFNMLKTKENKSNSKLQKKNHKTMKNRKRRNDQENASEEDLEMRALDNIKKRKRVVLKQLNI